jgi:hypothetical protein
MPRLRSPTDEILAIQACADMTACSSATLDQPGVTAFVPPESLSFMADTRSSFRWLQAVVAIGTFDALNSNALRETRQLTQQASKGSK